MEATTGVMSFENTVAICATVVVCMAIAAIAVCCCMKMAQSARLKSLKCRQEDEDSKRDNEKSCQADKNRLDCASRCLNDFCKKAEKDLNEEEKCLKFEMVKNSWRYLMKEEVTAEVPKDGDRS